MESKAELLVRFQVVKAKYDTAVKQMNRMKHGPARTRKAMWAGSLGFTLSQIKSDLEEISNGMATQE